MVFNQPCEEVAFFFGVVVVGGELLCVFDAFFGVIAAAAFGDVVQQGGGVEDVWSWVGLHDGAGLGHFVAVGFDGETAHIADDGQDVLIEDSSPFSLHTLLYGAQNEAYKMS